jgi:hypothetical protein
MSISLFVDDGNAFDVIEAEFELDAAENLTCGTFLGISLRHIAILADNPDARILFAGKRYKFKLEPDGAFTASIDTTGR